MLKKFFSKSKAKKAEAKPAKKQPPAELEGDVVLRASDLCKTFDGFEAVKDISFELKKGDCLGIIGMNGAGKSTLLRIIAGALPATSGTIQTKGRIVALLELGTGFNPDFTGIENIYLNASVLGIPRKVIDEKLPEIEAFAEIGEFIHKPVKTYSSGMAVRLAFAMLTQVDPDIMIIDEALSVGDTYFSHKCTHLIRSFIDAGKTFLIVSHSAGAVTSLCTKAILLQQGEVLRTGATTEVLDYYNALISQKEEDSLFIQQTQYKNRTITRSGSGQIRITEFELLDENDEPKKLFNLGDKLKIFCTIVAKETSESPTIGFLIKDKLGNHVYGTNTFHLKFDTDTIEEGESKSILFETNLEIGPGQYSITLAVHKDANHTADNYDWFDGIEIFKVLPDPKECFDGIARLSSTVSIPSDSIKPSRAYSYGTVLTMDATDNITKFLTEGWSVPEKAHIWSDGLKATILLDIEPSTTDRTLKLFLSPYLDDTTTSQIIKLKLGNELEFEEEIEKPTHLEFQLPSNILLDSQTLKLSLDLPNSKSRDKGPDKRALGIALRSIEIT